MTLRDSAGAPAQGGADAARLAGLVETWRSAIDSFVALARDIPAEQWDLPTDLDGWSVKDNVAHTAHLESVLAGAPEETLAVDPAPHIKDLTGFYTEQGVLARRDRDMSVLVAEIEKATAARYADLQAAPPQDGSAMPPRTPGGVPWNTDTLLNNRPLDVWMHEQDIRRAIGRPGGYDGAPAAHAVRRLAGALPMVLGKRVGPPAGTSVRIDLSDGGASWSVAIGEDGRAARVERVTDPTVLITLTTEEFVVLAGGRRELAATSPDLVGDTALGEDLLSKLSVTP